MIRLFLIKWGFACLLAIMGSGWAQAQKNAEAAAYLRKINEVYSQTTDYQFSIEYKVYRDVTSSQAVETSRGAYHKKGKNYVWILGAQHIVQNSHYFVSVDNEGQSLLVGKPVKQSVAFMPLSLDSLLQFTSFCQVVERGEDKEIQFSFEHMLDNVSRMDIRFNKTSFITRLVLYYNNFSEEGDLSLVSSSPRLEMAFTPLEEKRGDEFFSEKNFFHVKEGVITPAGAYKNYFLIDQRF